MGIKKAVFQSCMSRLSAKGKRDRRWLTKMAVFTLATTLLLIVSTGFLLYLAGGKAKELVADRPDPDLTALAQPIAEKSLTLSAEQQRRLAPLLATLAASDLAPEQAAALKTQLLNVFTHAQLAKMEAWNDAAATQAEGLLALSPAVVATVAKYTGISAEIIAARINALLAWWQPRPPENSVEQLQKIMRSI